MTALAQTLREKCWQPGHSGNPSGKGGLYHEMQRLAREFTPRATEILRDIANDPGEDSRNRIVAIGMLFDRAWGKPKEYDATAEKPAEPDFNPRDYAPEELDVIEAALRLMLNPPKKEVEVIGPGSGSR
jgi:hypothetical protein